MKIDRSVKPETGSSMTSKAYRVRQTMNKDEKQAFQQRSQPVQRKPREFVQSM